MERITYWDEEARSYLLQEKYKGDVLTERDLINIIGEYETEEEKLKEINKILKKGIAI
jgi:hypothetical protein